MSTTPKTKKTTTGTRQRRTFPAKVKCEAVLSLWAERRKPTEICRELGIPWQQLQSWQRQALEAMMERLQPRKEGEQRGPALGIRVQKLLDKTHRRVNRQNQLEKRLETIQQGATKPTNKP